MLNVIKFMRKALDTPVNSEFRHKFTVVIQIFTRILPLSIILSLSFFDKNIDVNLIALEVFGQLCLGSDEDTVQFNGILTSPYSLIVENFIQKYIDIMDSRESSTLTEEGSFKSQLLKKAQKGRLTKQIEETKESN